MNCDHIMLSQRQAGQIAASSPSHHKPLTISENAGKLLEKCCESWGNASVAKCAAIA